MPLARVYLPLTSAQLTDLAVHRELSGERLRAHAVTRELADRLPGADEEELEYAALEDASDAARGMRDTGQTHRVIAAADVDEASLHAPGDAGSDVASRRDVRGPVPLRRVASFHVDESPADDADLLWYDVTEIDEVVRLSTA